MSRGYRRAAEQLYICEAVRLYSFKGYSAALLSIKIVRMPRGASRRVTQLFFELQQMLVVRIDLAPQHGERFLEGAFLFL